ncbi:MAG: HEAT repeat domain-containing protein [Planctomycetota bacterium]
MALLHGDDGVKALEDIMGRGTPDERASAAMALARRKHPYAFDVLVTELLHGHGEKKWQRHVVGTLARQYGDKLLAWADAQGPDRPRCQPLESALAQARIAAADASAVDVLRDGLPSVRAAALKLLARRKREAIIPELRRCLREGRPTKAARQAFYQMRRLGDAAMPVVLEMLASEHWTERKAAVCLLRHWGKLTEQQHERASKDPHVAVRHAADWRPDDKGKAKWHLKKWRRWQRRAGRTEK